MGERASWWISGLMTNNESCRTCDASFGDFHGWVKAGWIIDGSKLCCSGRSFVGRNGYVYRTSLIAVGFSKHLGKFRSISQMFS